MEKISGILPSSPRVSSVDMKESSPVRPGTPGFGRAEGAASVRKAKIGETAATAAAIGRDRLDWKSKDMQNAAVVRDLSDRFFKGNQQENQNSVGIGKDSRRAVSNMETIAPISIEAVDSVPAGFKKSGIDRVLGNGAFAGSASSGILDDREGRELDFPSIAIPSGSAKTFASGTDGDAIGIAAGVTAGFGQSEIVGSKVDSNSEKTSGEKAPQPDGLYPRGSFIDFRA